MIGGNNVICLWNAFLEITIYASIGRQMALMPKSTYSVKASQSDSASSSSSSTSVPIVRIRPTTLLLLLLCLQLLLLPVLL
jgi:hypothetical protein